MVYLTDLTFSALYDMGVNSDVNVYVGVSGPTLYDLEKSDALLKSFTKSAARWISVKNFQGLAYIEYASYAEHLVDLQLPLKVQTLFLLSFLFVSQMHGRLVTTLLVHVSVLARLPFPFEYRTYFWRDHTGLVAAVGDNC